MSLGSKKKYQVYGIGNALVDYVYSIDQDFFNRELVGTNIRSSFGEPIHKGIMTLIDSETKKSVESKLINNRSKVESCGGSAANTMIALADLGSSVFYSCKVAGDSAGKFYKEDLISHNVETNLNIHNISQNCDGFDTGACIVLVTPDADRTMLTSLGTTVNFAENEIDFEKIINNSEWLYVEGYLVASDVSYKALLKAIECAKKNSVKVALTCSDPFLVKNFRSRFEEILKYKIDLMFCNLEEAMAITLLTNGPRDSSPAVIAEMIKNNFDISSIAITCGKDGAFYFDGKESYFEVAPKINPVDSVGAGDLFAGALLYAINEAWHSKRALKLAVHAASTIVAQYGARLKKEELLKLRAGVELCC